LQQFPIEKNCDLKITGSHKEAVIDTAFNHAVGPMHQHEPTSEELRDMIRQAVETQTSALGRSFLEGYRQL